MPSKPSSPAFQEPKAEAGVARPTFFELFGADEDKVLWMQKDSAEPVTQRLTPHIRKRHQRRHQRKRRTRVKSTIGGRVVLVESLAHEGAT